MSTHQNQTVFSRATKNGSHKHHPFKSGRSEWESRYFCLGGFGFRVFPNQLSPTKDFQAKQFQKKLSFKFRPCFFLKISGALPKASQGKKMSNPIFIPLALPMKHLPVSYSVAVESRSLISQSLWPFFFFCWAGLIFI